MNNTFINKLLILILFSPLSLFASENEKQVKITLTNGDVLNGYLIKNKSSAATKVINHPQLGELTIRKSKIKSLENYSDKTVTSSRNSERIRSSENKKWSGSIGISVDQDFEHRHYSDSLDLDFSSDLNHKKGLYTNSIKFDWTTEKDKYKSGENFDSHSIEFDIASDRETNIKNLTLHFSNKYDYESDADYGMYNTVTTFGLTKVFSTPDDIYLAVSFGPAINFVYGGDDCDITIDCGENFLASSITSTFSKQLTKRFEIELENEYTASFASTAKYGNEFSSTLTFRPSDESGFNTSFEYTNDFQELSDPEIEHKYSLNIGYDF